jgi:hypothetical protein
MHAFSKHCACDSRGRMLLLLLLLVFLPVVWLRLLLCALPLLRMAAPASTAAAPSSSAVRHCSIALGQFTCQALWDPDGD